MSNNNSLIVAPTNLPAGQTVRDVIASGSNITSKYTAQLPKNGNIRLGKKKTTANGVEYPENLDYFVIDEVPELKKLIPEGSANLKEFVGLFVSNDHEQSYQHGHVLFTGGRKDSSGKMVGGALKCRGTGPKLNKDGSLAEPGVAEYVDIQVDPATNREVKSLLPRQCLGEHGCPDAKNAKGVLVCKPRMRVWVMIPSVSIDGVYELSTGSISSILDFSSRLEFMRMTYGGYKMFPFKFYREGVLLGQGKNKGVQHILKLKPIDADEYWSTEGAKIREKIEALSKQNITVNNNDGTDSMSAQAAKMAAQNADVDVSSSGYNNVEVVGPTPQELCEEVLGAGNALSAQINDMFAELAMLAGSPNLEQKRKLFVATVISKNNLKEVAKISEVTINALGSKIAQEKAKKSPPPSDDLI
jgi:hypothetical protein